MQVLLFLIQKLTESDSCIGHHISTVQYFAVSTFHLLFQTCCNVSNLTHCKEREISVLYKYHHHLVIITIIIIIIIIIINGNPISTWLV